MVRPRQTAMLDSARSGTDQRVVFRDISWEQYRALDAARGNKAVPRLTYFEGVLEFMTPSDRHEDWKKLIARLVEAYGDELQIPLIGMGSTTFRKKAKQSGLEPDECYCLGAKKNVPDFAIEIVHTGAGVEKLVVYERLGIPEVWFWIRGRFHLFSLSEGGYESRARSRFLPDLDLEELAAIVVGSEPSDQPKAVWEYRAHLRSRRTKK